MNARTAVLLVGLLSLGSAGGFAQDYGAWIRYSDRSDNALIIEMISQGDLSVALQAASALGLREDPGVQEIILSVAQQSDERPRWERELILRTILASVFPSSLQEAELEWRLAENRRGIAFLLDHLHQFELSLKREVMRLLAFTRERGQGSVLMREGRVLADLLLHQRGQLNGEQAGLVLAYLQTVERLGDVQFADICLLILERSRHLEVAEKARSVSKTLLLQSSLLNGS